MIRVLFVDDEPRLLRAWGKLFAAHEGIEMVGTRESAEGLSDAVRDLSPDIVILDIGMPGPDPLDSIRELDKTHPSVRCVVHTGHSSPTLIQSAFDAGAWGFVDKLIRPEDLFDVLHRVAGGETVFPPTSPPPLRGDVARDSRGPAR